MELIVGEHRLGPSLVTLPTPGHTPGHTSVIVQSGNERGCILGDVVLTPIDAEMPALDTSFDWDHALARSTREAMIARLAGDGSLVGASHLTAPGFGRFTLDAGRSKWTPA
jgi:glyoxylase-like metal-dependent hydrolase (beta-lactamase superfamily II)